MDLKKQIDATIDENVKINLLVKEQCYSSILELINFAKKSMKKKGKVILFGNGGSAADSQHIAAEFMGKFKNKKRFLHAISLTTNSSILSAIGNDFGFDEVFAIQIKSLASKNDLVIGISTSGNSINVKNGIIKSKERGAKTIALLGNNGGVIKEYVDIPIIVENSSTSKIQEVHRVIYHIICEYVESKFT